VYRDTAVWPKRHGRRAPPRETARRESRRLIPGLT